MTTDSVNTGYMLLAIIVILVIYIIYVLYFTDPPPVNGEFAVTDCAVERMDGDKLLCKIEKCYSNFESAIQNKRAMDKFLPQINKVTEIFRSFNKSATCKCTEDGTLELEKIEEIAQSSHPMDHVDGSFTSVERANELLAEINKTKKLLSRNAVFSQKYIDLSPLTHLILVLHDREGMYAPSKKKSKEQMNVYDEIRIRKVNDITRENDLRQMRVGDKMSKHATSVANMSDYTVRSTEVDDFLSK